MSGLPRILSGRSKPNRHTDAVKLVNIGTVAETGDRLAPIHVGRTGDPVMPSVFDYYACTKIEAERIVAESGLRYWVSLRQTFILSTETKPVPIMFHMPLNTCFEACSLPDAGRVLVNVTRQDLPEEFWRRFYNIGGGPKSSGSVYRFPAQINGNQRLEMLKMSSRESGSPCATSTANGTKTRMCSTSTLIISITVLMISSKT